MELQEKRFCNIAFCAFSPNDAASTLLSRPFQTEALVKIRSGGVGSLRPLRLDFRLDFHLDFRFDLSTLVLHELHELVVCKEHERDEQTQSDHAAGKASVDGFSLRSSSAPVGS